MFEIFISVTPEGSVAERERVVLGELVGSVELIEREAVGGVVSEVPPLSKIVSDTGSLQLPSTFLNLAYTVFAPSPEVSVHVSEVLYSLTSDQVVPLLENCIKAPC